MTNPLTAHIALAGFALAALAPAWPAAPVLPRLGADIRQTSVSGFSSGAFMAGQFAVAYSSIVKGVGMIAGGPYYCTGEPATDPPLRNALTRCMNPEFSRTDPPDAVSLWRSTRRFAQQGLIDNTAHLAGQRVYLFNGAQDKILTSAVTDQARNFYDMAGARSITYVNHGRAGHGMVTDRPGDNDCGASYQPFFNNCGIPLARHILAAVAGPMMPASARPEGQLRQFSQRRFAGAASGLAQVGYVYVPKDCTRGGCRVHVAFHGCWQNAQAVGDHFYRHAGYNETADANRIIVLYPQAAASTAPLFNPAGCWDYWGYTNPDYYTRRGIQLAAVRAMLKRLGER